MIRTIREIALYIRFYYVDCFLAHIDGVHGFGTAAKGVKGEAAGVAEHIQDIFAMGVALDEGTILTLVDEETRLLAP